MSDEEKDITELFDCDCHDLCHVAQLGYFASYKEDPESMYLSLLIDPYRIHFLPYNSCDNFFSKKFWTGFYYCSVYKRFVVSFKYFLFKKYKDKDPLFSSINFKAKDLERFCRLLDAFETEVKEIDESQLELEIESRSYRLKFCMEDYFDDDYFPPTLQTFFQFKKEKGFKKLWEALKYAFGSTKSNYGRTDEFELTAKDAKILKNIVKKIKEIALERIEKNPEQFVEEKKIFTNLLEGE